MGEVGGVFRDAAGVWTGGVGIRKEVGVENSSHDVMIHMEGAVCIGIATLMILYWSVMVESSMCPSNHQSHVLHYSTYVNS